MQNGNTFVYESELFVTSINGYVYKFMNNHAGCNKVKSNIANI
jgi:hypothetical protein